MPIMYDGIHSVLFIKSSQKLLPNEALTEYSTLNHSWFDLHLIPSSRPFVVTPEVSVLMANDSVSNRTFDITDDVAGGQMFGIRQGEWEFIIDHDKWDNWYTAKKAIEDYVNGKRLYCCLMDDYSTLYCGRFVVSGWNDGPSYSTVTIQYYLDYDVYSLGIDFNKPSSLSVSLNSSAPKFYVNQSKNSIKSYVNAVVTDISGKQRSVFIDDLSGVFTENGTQIVDVSYTEKGWGTGTVYTVDSQVSVTVGSDSISSILAFYNTTTHNVYASESKDVIRRYINLSVTYQSGTTETIDGSNADVISGTFDSEGQQDVTITYRGKTTTMSVSVGEDSTVAISCSYKSDPPTFRIGEAKDSIRQYIDLAVVKKNGRILVLDGSSADTISGVFVTEGNYNVMVTYDGQSTTVNVTVAFDPNNPVTSISASYKGDAPYIAIGDQKDKIRQYVNLFVTFNNGNTVTIDGINADEISGTFTEERVQDVILTYGGKSTTMSVVVSNPISKISVSYKNGAPDIMVGSSKDVIRQYINITVTYASGSTEVVDGLNAEPISGTFDTVGYEYVKINYGGKSINLHVQISDGDNVLDYIEVAWEDSEPTIYVGQSKNLVRQYITVTATYKNGRKESDIDGGYTELISGTFETAGLQSVTITYRNKTASISLTIADAADSWNVVKQSIIAGTYATAYPLGSKIPIVINGKTNNAIVVGIDADVDENGNAIPLTFITEYYINDRVYMNDYDTGNVGGYPETYVRNTYLENVYTTLDNSVKSIIVPASKKSRLANVLKTTIDKLWIPSTREIIPDLYPYPEWEGPTYGSLFDTAEKRIKKSSANGLAENWWLRTTGTSFGSGGSFIMIDDDGEGWSSGSCNGQWAIVLGFCVGNPSD